MRPLAGRTVVVTRAAEQAGPLAERLTALGAVVVELPVIAVAEPSDGGAALAKAVADLARYDWAVVTSANGAERLADAAGPWPDGVRLAAVGPGTAAALAARGLASDLVAERSVAEGLVEVFPPGPGRVLAVQAEQARPVLADGLRAKGWTVDAVVAYRTVAANPAPELLERAAAADAVTFTSGSTVRAYLAAGTRVPPVVVTIGPVTSDVARAAGLVVRREASPHSLDGLVEAVVDALAT